MTLHNSPRSYAEYLASYISDASTIRVRVREMFDTVPTLKVIQGFIDARKKKEAKRKAVYAGYWSCGHAKDDDNVIITKNGGMICRTCGCH